MTNRTSRKLRLNDLTATLPKVTGQFYRLGIIQQHKQTGRNPGLHHLTKNKNSVREEEKLPPDFSLRCEEFVLRAAATSDTHHFSVGNEPVAFVPPHDLAAGKTAAPDDEAHEVA